MPVNVCEVRGQGKGCVNEAFSLAHTSLVCWWGERDVLPSAAA